MISLLRLVMRLTKLEVHRHIKSSTIIGKTPMRAKGVPCVRAPLLSLML